MKNLKFTILTILLILGTANAQMVWNHAAKLEGTNSSYISVADKNSSNKMISNYLFNYYSLLYVERPITAECWIYPENANSPEKQIILQKAENNNATGFAFFLNQGKPSVKVNNVTILSTVTSLPSQKWSHIAFTFYNKTYSIYINGILYTQLVSNIYPKTNLDSLYIGKGSESPFKGLIDEVRLWGRALSTDEIKRNFRSSLATYAGFNSNYSVPNDLAPNGVYSGLVLSLTFQDDEQVGSIFSLSDWSGCNFHAKGNGISQANFSHSPSASIFQNESLDFMSGNSKVTTPDNMYNSPTGAITVEFWVWTSAAIGYTNILRKAANDYAFKFGTAFQLYALVNNTIFESGYSFSNNDCLNKWTHVAFTYSQGNYKFVINGEEVKTGFQNVGNINNGTDSLYFGEYFTGYLDEVRISNYVKPTGEIKKHMYVSFDKSNTPNQTPGNTNLCYSFDGYGVDQMGQAGTKVFFRKNAGFSSPGTMTDVPVSPVNRSDVHDFSYDWRMSDFLRMPVPSSGFSGEISSSLQVSANVTINDVNVYAAINHTNENDLRLYLITPTSDTIQLFGGENQLGQNDNLITIFDDEADSSLLSGKYTAFGPVIMPKEKINPVVAGKSSTGTWTLLVKDAGAAADVGILYNWGLQINGMKISKPTGGEIGIGEPFKYSLSQNFPNPFNPSTQINFSIARDTDVKITLYDAIGRETGILLNEFKTAGFYSVQFDGSNLATGVYFYRITAGDFSDIKKMILVK